jgi:putative methyltransferase (TIGR04325 family)
MANWKSLLVRLLPPIVTDMLRALKQRSGGSRSLGSALAGAATGGPPEWEAVGIDRWTVSNGWLHPSIVATQADKWKSFSQEIRAPMPFGRSHEANPGAAVNITAHNITMTFAYGVARAIAARGEAGAPVGILDWGGGIGHYASLVHELYPEVRFDYVIRELETLAEAGRPLLPDVRFVCDDQEALSRSYDLIFASSSLQYSRGVYDVLKMMARTGSRWIMVCRMPFVDAADDFVVIQRPYRYGYDTEYSGWFLNRFKFIEFMKAEGYSLEREFLNDERPYVPNAPEQCVYRAYLFRRDV